MPPRMTNLARDETPVIVVKARSRTVPIVSLSFHSPQPPEFLPRGNQDVPYSVPLAIPSRAVRRLRAARARELEALQPGAPAIGAAVADHRELRGVPGAGPDGSSRRWMHGQQAAAGVDRQVRTPGVVAVRSQRGRYTPYCTSSERMTLIAPTETAMTRLAIAYAVAGLAMLPAPVLAQNPPAPPPNPAVRRTFEKFRATIASSSSTCGTSTPRPAPTRSTARSVEPVFNSCDR